MQGIYELLPGRPDFDESKFRLGPLCKRGHDWHGTGRSLRYVHDGCVECKAETRAAWYEANKEAERLKAIERQRQRRSTEEGRLRSNDSSRRSNAKRRAEIGRESRSKYGLPWRYLEENGFENRQGPAVAELHAKGWSPEEIRTWLELDQALTSIKPCSVADLVEQAQRLYWVEHPEERQLAERQANRLRAAWRHMTDPEYRLYHRQKSKRRKALMRSSVGIQLSGRQVRARFAEFGHSCAYCGAAGDLHIEHVVPISKGGTHAMGNIVPACRHCNFSKAAHDAETWYQRQPFYSEVRWRKICRVLGWGKSPVGQLALL